MRPCSTAVAAEQPELPIRSVAPDLFHNIVRRLHTLFTLYANTCPVPIPAPGLIVTAEVRNQCECYLPIGQISAAFFALYRSALSYPPVFSSSPFHKALSWADVFAALPRNFQFSANPARLLEALCADPALLTEFLFASFLPARFYNGFGRYPRQLESIRSWLMERNLKTVRCLDAACGTGEGVYDLAFLLADLGFAPDDIHIDGWTLEPLEVWSAITRRFPHNRRGETEQGKAASVLIRNGYLRCMSFTCRDMFLPTSGAALSECGEQGGFDIILCNGLLGGPILHEKEELGLAVGNLAELLAPGGVLLAADSFHGGWKQHCPQSQLQAVFESNRLKACEAGEGIGGLKSDQ